MKVDVLTQSSEVDACMEEWDALFSAYGRDPFQNPRWYQIWWDCVGQYDGCQPHVVTGRVDGRLAAIAPLVVSRALGIRKLEWAGTQFFDYPEVLAADDADVLAFWMTIRRTGRFDIARLKDVRHDGRSRPVLELFGKPTGPGSPVYQIDLCYPSGAAWFDSLSTRMRANQRANVRQIEKKGPLTMTMATTPEAVIQDIDILIELKCAWARARDTEIRMDSPEVRAFVQNLALQCLNDGTLCLSSLKCGDHTISTILGFVGRDEFYYYLPAYDLAYAKMSPGRVHLMMLITQAVDNGHRRFDFLRGSDSYKILFGKPAKTLHDYTFSRGLIGGLAARVHSAMNRQNSDQVVAVAAE